MSMLNKFKQRSYELERIDKGDYTPEEYEGCIVELQRVNRWLGDAHVLRNTLLRDVASHGLESFSVLDVGAGSGELLRVASQWAQKEQRELFAVGLELNQRSAEAILEESNNSINAIRADALKLPFVDGQFDYVICSLFTHHFVEQQVIEIFREMTRVARRRVFVIDLHRHFVAYFFYTTIGRLFLHTSLLREDGALSILRSFKPNELVELGHRAEMNGVFVKRHFPFRLVLTADGQGASRYAETHESASRAA
jgi:ubiquinone/menaquinone biosynthesis C-methylase UbiE